MLPPQTQVQRVDYSLFIMEMVEKLLEEMETPEWRRRPAAATARRRQAAALGGGGPWPPLLLLW